MATLTKKHISFAAAIFALLISLVAVIGYLPTFASADNVKQGSVISKITATASSDGTITIPNTNVKNDTGYLLTINDVELVAESGCSFVNSWTNDFVKGTTVPTGETLSIAWQANEKLPSSWDKTGSVKVATITYYYSYDTSLTGKVKIEGATDGKAKCGDTLSAVAEDLPSDAVPHYTWYDEEGNKLGEGQTYTPTEQDVGKTIIVKVTDDSGKYDGELDSSQDTSGDDSGKIKITTPIDDASITLDADSLEYNGSNQTANITSIKLSDGTELTEDDYEIVSGVSGKDVDTYTLVINGKGIYSGQISTTWKITPKPVAITWTWNPQSAETDGFAYNGSDQAPTATVTASDIAGSDSVTPTVVVYKGDTKVEAGGYTDIADNYRTEVVDLNNDNYEISSTAVTSKSFKIVAKELTEDELNNISLVIPADGYTYDGSEKKPTVSGLPDGITANDYDITYENNVDAGQNTAKATVTFKGNCQGNTSIQFSIAKAKITVSGIVAKNKVYDATTNAELDTDNVLLDGCIEADKEKLSIDADSIVGTFDNTDGNGKNVGDGKTVNISGIVLSGDAAKNYELATDGQQSTATANITAKPVGITWIWNPQSAETDGFAYNGSDQSPTGSVTTSDIAGSDSVTPTVVVYKGETKVEAGGYTDIADDYKIEVTGLDNSNYVLSGDATTSKDFKIVGSYALDKDKLKAVLKTLSGDSPTTLKFVTGDSEELNGLTCVSTDGIQTSTSAKIGVFKSNDGKTIYVAPMNSDGTPAGNNKTISAPVNSSHLLDGSDTGLSTLTSISCANLDTSNVTDMSRMFIGNYALTTLDVSKFNTSKVENFSYMFSSCSSLVSLDVTNFDTSSATDMTDMFSNNYALASLDVSKFNTSKVTSFNSMFGGCNSLASLDVTNFDTSSATDMAGMFYNNSALASLDVSKFNTSKVLYFTNMFYNNSALASLDVTNFDTSSATDMGSMFSNDSGLTTLDVSKFNTSKVENFSYMFSSCSSLTSLDVTNFDTSSATDMSSMFANCDALTTLDLSSFNTSKVTDMSNMFKNDEKLTSIYVSDSFVTDKVTSSGNMFLNCDSLVGGAGTAYDSSHIDKEYAHKDGGISNPGYFQGVVSYYLDKDKMQTVLKTLSSDNPTTLKFVTGNSSEISNLTCIDAALAGIETSVSDGKIGIFQSSDKKTIYIAPMNSDGTPANSSKCIYAPANCSSLLSYSNTQLGTLVDISCANLDTSNTTSMSSMFFNCSSLRTVDVSRFNTKNVTSMDWMFCGCESLASLDVTNFVTSNVARMGSMFRNCSSLASLNVSNFDTSKVTNMYVMFYGCSSLSSLDLSNFDTSNITDMRQLFQQCTNLETINLSGFNTSNVTGIEKMFYDCTSLKTITVGSNFVLTSVSTSYEMFTNCTNLVGGAGTVFDSTKVDKTYARIDGGTSSPGYFTGVA